MNVKMLDDFTVSDRPARVIEGDQVVIRVKGVDTVGTVVSASWYGVKDGWYIEFTRLDNGRYGYWKQGMDGGELVKHKRPIPVAG